MFERVRGKRRVWLAAFVVLASVTTACRPGFFRPSPKQDDKTKCTQADDAEPGRKPTRERKHKKCEEETAPDLFDSSVVHDVEVTFDQDEYDAMIETFRETGDKEWIEATVTIDGTTYEQVGLRLKGNSSLFGLGGGFPGGFEPPEGWEPPEGFEPPTTTTTVSPDGEEPPETTLPPDGEGPPGGFPGGPGGATAEEPEELPWLIRFDEYVDDQLHQGHQYLNIRSSSSQTSLNEAVALDLLDEAGLASQQATAVRFTVNDKDPILRLGIEVPDDDAWQDRTFVDCKNGLYKAESTGDWSYRGDDPDAYDDVFDQEGGKNTVDMAPLIDFLKFINEADDATFAAELPERLDVDAFATYLAMMDLLANWDDIDGPGNNAYIAYDTCTEKMTIVPWDMNLALGVGFGGGGGFPGPGGVEPPEGFEPPEGWEPPDGFDPDQVPGFGGSNPLVQKFHANPDFEALYQQTLTDLRASLYESGVAGQVLDARAEVLERYATDLVDEETITTEAAAISELFTPSE